VRVKHRGILYYYASGPMLLNFDDENFNKKILFYNNARERQKE